MSYVFKFDDKFEENEQKYKNLSKDILGSDIESGEEGESAQSGSEESEQEDEEKEKKEMTIIDNTETNLVALRRTIYLTINSSLDFEECAHKLMKMQLKPGQEVELCHMFLDCCAEQRTYEKFYGLLAQRFCNINRIYIGPFEEIFKDSYATAHRLDTNRLRNVSKFFAHLLFTDSISWEVLECVKLNEEDTTSSSRIYIKILFQELAEYMGLKKLNDRLQDPTLQEAFSGIFPRDNPRNTRFSINFFTSIGLGGLTDELREHLKQMPKNVPAPVAEITVPSEDESSSSSSSSSHESSSSSDSSSSDTEDESNKKDKEKKSKRKNKDETLKTPPENRTDKNDNKDRWGHDGFFDTYGKDARRTESIKERENFAQPHDVRNNDRNRNFDERNEGHQRETYYRRKPEEESRRNRDDRRYERNLQHTKKRSDIDKDKISRSRYEDSNGRRYDRDDNNKDLKSGHSRDDDDKEDSRNKKENKGRRIDKDNGQKDSSKYRKSSAGDEEKNTNEKNVKSSYREESRRDNHMKGDKSKSDNSENYDSRGLRTSSSKREVSGRYWDTYAVDHKTSQPRTRDTTAKSRERSARS